MSQRGNVQVYIKSLPIIRWQGGVQRGCKGDKKGKLKSKYKEKQDFSK